MNKYNLEDRGDTPIYEFLYKSIRDDIRSGILRAGEKMPSKRMLAHEYGVSLITVQNAYEQLVMEGYLDSVMRKGYYVADIVPVSVIGGDDRMVDGSGNRSDAGKNTTSGDRRKPALKDIMGCEGRSDECIDLTTGRIRCGNFPYGTWSRLMRKTLADEESSFLQKPESTGLYELRVAISDYLRTEKGLMYDPENIVIGAGTEYLYTMVVWLLGRNGMYAVEDPGHLTVSRIFEANGVKVLYIPVDSEGFSIMDLNVTNPLAIHISPSHQFPTGMVMPAKRRHDIIEWAKVHNCYIIEDDYDSEFRYQGRPVPAMAGLDRDHVIYMNTFSRTLSPSVRIAYMALPDALAKLCREKLGFMTCPVSVADQMTLAKFIDGGYYTRHISRMKKFYHINRDRILEEIKNSGFGNCVDIRGEGTGLHFLMEVKDKNVDMEKYIHSLYDRGIHIKRVSDYSKRSSTQYERLLIFSYSHILPEELPGVFDEMKEEILSCR